MDCYKIAGIALDAATAIDRARQGRESDLSPCAALADAIRAAWDEADPVVVDDMLAALTPREGRLDTVDDLAAAVREDEELMRRASAAEPAALPPAMARCLHMHRVLLTRDRDRFGPYGLVA